MIDSTSSQEAWSSSFLWPLLWMATNGYTPCPDNRGSPPNYWPHLPLCVVSPSGHSLWSRLGQWARKKRSHVPCNKPIHIQRLIEEGLAWEPRFPVQGNSSPSLAITWLNGLTEATASWSANIIHNAWSCSLLLRSLNGTRISHSAPPRDNSQSEMMPALPFKWNWDR